ncbi:MAG: transferase [Prevotella sp.]|nr:transferase [Prevotella sp.]
MKRKIYALGIGHNSPVFIDLALACGYEIAGLWHYNDLRTNDSDHGYKILGSFDDLFNSGRAEGCNFLLTMGDSAIRDSLCNRIIANGGHVPTLIHPTATISKFATVSDIGVYISPYAFLQADSQVGSNSVLLSHVNVSHTTKIGKSCFLAGGSTIGAYTTVEDFCFIGQGALSISGKVSVIGHHAYIGARALLTRSVPAYAIMAGSPARQIGVTNGER